MKYLLLIQIGVLALIAGCKKDDKPGLATISTTAASSITPNSAQIGGTIANTGGSAISKSGICFALHTNPSVSDSIVASNMTGAGAFLIPLTNLNANTTYYFKAFAINAIGTAYGKADSFVTAKGVPTVTTTAISNNQALKAQTGGNVTNDGGATVSARGICWSASPHPTTGDSKLSGGTGTGIFSDTLTNLSLKTYYLRAFATNSYGTAYGNEITFTVNATGTVTDIDGNAYTTVTLGTQTWMGSNLRVTHYKNGDPIVNGLATNFDWWGTILHSTYIGAYTFPNGDSANNVAYGKLYNNYAVDDSRGVCPTGWHVPSVEDWTVLEFNQGMIATDTAQRNRVNGGSNYEGAIGDKFFGGGVSGLNFERAGYYLINPGNGGNAYYAFGTGGTAANLSSTTYTDVRLKNYWLFFNEAGAPSSSIHLTANYTYSASIRCVKD